MIVRSSDYHKFAMALRRLSARNSKYNMLPHNFQYPYQASVLTAEKFRVAFLGWC